MEHTPAHTPEQTAALAPSGLESALAHAAELAADSIAPTTRRAYAADWSAFVRWAEAQGPDASPALPVSVATCAAWLADMEVSVRERAS